MTGLDPSPGGVDAENDSDLTRSRLQWLDESE